MARLPLPGGDEGNWGDILNDFLKQAHRDDGMLKSGVVGSAALAASSVDADKIKDGVISEAKLDPALVAKVNSGGVAGVASINSRTGAVTLNKADVGLSNVDNTSDAAKPISNATQTALNTKANVSHSHTAANISDFTATTQGIIGARIKAGANVTVNYDSTTGNTTISAASQGSAIATDLSVTQSATNVTVNSSTGADAVISSATATNAGAMSSADKSKLDGIAAGATVNASNAQLRDRSTHTGTQSIATVTGLQTALDSKVASNDVIRLSGDQTAAGVKTFSNSPIVPTPTAASQAANKSYVDSAVAGAATTTTDRVTVVWDATSSSYPAQSSTPPNGVKVREFIGPQLPSAAAWSGVVDLYTYANFA